MVIGRRASRDRGSRRLNEQNLVSEQDLLNCKTGRPGRGNRRLAGSSRLRTVGEWYSIGLAIGLAVAGGVGAAGVLGRGRAGAAAAGLLAGGAGLLIGLLVFGIAPAVAAAAGGVTGGLGAGQVARGTARRGGTRLGMGVLFAACAVLLAALALVPALGYVEGVLVPVLGLRLRRRTPGRYAGLRLLARD
jgi:hypothetical protein